MKLRLLGVPLIMTILTGCGFAMAPESRAPWIIIAALCFAGILIFDSYKEIPRTWLNTVLFLAVYGLTVLGVTEATSEGFWRDYAGAVFLIAFLFEQNSMPWSGMGWLRSTMGPALLFFVLTMAQSIPFLTAESLLACALAAILIFSFLEIFSILRENNDLNSGSFMSALRMAACGTGVLFYSGVFLPGAAREFPFSLIRVALPAVGLLAAVMSTFLKQWRRRYILFCCNWSVFLFWACTTNEPNRFYAAAAGLVAGVWTIMMTNKLTVDPAETRDLYLKLSAWGVPGSLLFSMIVFLLYPSQDLLVREGTALWLATFVVYWSSLRKFEFSKRQGEVAVWRWQNSLALGITIAGAGLVAGIKIFPELMQQVWGLTK